MNAFTMEELERLEEIVCPRCGGSGVTTAATLGIVAALGLDLGPCDICNGHRHVWRVATEAER